jgi:hypothetical protein
LVSRLQFRGAGFFNDTNNGYRTDISGAILRPGDYFEDFVSQKVVIIQRGVDPYSPLLTNKYSVGRIFGQDIDDPNWTFTASTRVNIPIQKVPVGSTTTVPKHDNQDNIFFQSKFFTPGVSGSVTPGQQYSGFTTSNVRYYGSLDSTQTITSSYLSNISYGGTLKGIGSTTNNLLYSVTIGPNFYDSAEDLSGGEALYLSNPPTEQVGNALYGQYTVFVGSMTRYNFTTIYPPSTSLSISNPSKNIMRTGRLPSSDTFDLVLNPLGYPSLLQQNSVFASYVLQNNGSGLSVQPILSTGASQVTPDIEGQLAAGNVLESLTDCENMVGLTCYSGNSVNFGVKLGCPESDAVENGCYVFLNEFLGTDLQKDINIHLVNGVIGLDFFMVYVEEFYLKHLLIIGLMGLYICSQYKWILILTNKINHYHLILQKNLFILMIKQIIFTIEVLLIFQVVQHHKDLLEDQQQMD